MLRLGGEVPLRIQGLRALTSVSTRVGTSPPSCPAALPSRNAPTTKDAPFTLYTSRNINYHDVKCGLGLDIPLTTHQDSNVKHARSVD